MERWKDINGFEGLYMISDYGNVLSLKNNIIRKTKKNNRNYHQICLNKNGEQHYFLVHRLVAEHFIDNPNNYPQVNHKDENKDNNRADNLEWCTNRYNCRYGTRNERVRNSEGYIKHLNERKVRVAGKSIDGKIEVIFNGINISKRLGFSPKHINRACRGEIPVYKGMTWKYID